MLIDLTRRIPTILYDVEPTLVVVRVLSIDESPAWVRETGDGVVDGLLTPTLWSSGKGKSTWAHHVVPAPGNRDELLTYECTTMRFEVEPPPQDGPMMPWDGFVSIEMLTTEFHRVIITGPDGLECQCRVKNLSTLASDDNEPRMSLWERLGNSDA